MDLNQRFLAVMHHFHLNNGDFAQKLRISPGVISHISSGRNKPGLEITITLLQEFPEVSSDWLLLGEGSMLRPKNNTDIQDQISKLVLEVKMMNDMNYNGLNVRIESLIDRLK